MGRYRKIDVRMWHASEQFNRLSRPQPCGQFLWMRLLTGPETTNIPGLFSTGELALSEALRWPLKGFRKAFAELEQEGLAKADWMARVVWVPNSIRFNVPESPNVVRSWQMPWSEIPECPIKNEAYQTLYDFLKGMGEAFAKAFREALSQPSPNQEQEQEQEQKQEQETAGSSAAKPRPEPTPVPEPLAKIMPSLKRVRLENPGELYSSWSQAYPDVDVAAQILKCDAWAISKAVTRSPKGWARTLNTWLSREQDRAKGAKHVAGRIENRVAGHAAPVPGSPRIVD